MRLLKYQVTRNRRINELSYVNTIGMEVVHMKNKGFEGWYFKHQKGGDVLAFIPGIAESGAFIQMLSSAGSRQFDVPELAVREGVIYAGGCEFSRRGCRISLPGVTGEISYGALTPLRSDIMGPFRFLPMECRHGVISMGHTLSGSISVDGEAHVFDGGIGYIEKDSGTSFPSSYQWLQCNSFPEPCSVMLSVAHIPFGGLSFKGCICAIMHGGREYRLATYNGVRICAASGEHICLTQGNLLFEADIEPSQSGHPLRSPVKGSMSGTIRESSNAAVRIRLWRRGEPVFDLESNGAMYEYVPAK